MISSLPGGGKLTGGAFLTIFHSLTVQSSHIAVAIPIPRKRNLPAELEGNMCIGTTCGSTEGLGTQDKMARRLEAMSC